MESIGATHFTRSGFCSPLTQSFQEESHRVAPPHQYIRFTLRFGWMSRVKLHTLCTPLCTQSGKPCTVARACAGACAFCVTATHRPVWRLAPPVLAPRQDVTGTEHASGMPHQMLLR